VGEDWAILGSIGTSLSDFMACCGFRWSCSCPSCRDDIDGLVA
jgi:hypothetical protein